MAAEPWHACTCSHWCAMPCLIGDDALQQLLSDADAQEVYNSILSQDMCTLYAACRSAFRFHACTYSIAEAATTTQLLQLHQPIWIAYISNPETQKLTSPCAHLYPDAENHVTEAGIGCTYLQLSRFLHWGRL